MKQRQAAKAPSKPAKPSPPLKGGGLPLLDIAEAEPSKFHAAFTAAFKDSPFKNHVTFYSEGDLSKMKLFLTKDGKTGIAVKDHGDGRIEGTALFNLSTTKGAGLALLAHAVKHARVNYLECYGPVLNRLYKKAGFAVVTESRFNRESATAGWNWRRFDGPNYYTMKRA